MSFTPGTWLAEKLSRVPVRGKQVRSWVSFDGIPTPVVKAGLLAIVVLFFADEFLILAAIFGGPAALEILLAFAATVLLARRTERGRRLRDKSTRKAMQTLGASGQYDRRKER